MKFLHLVSDEKFTDFIISLLEACNPGNNIFLIGLTNKNGQPRFTKTKNDNIIFHTAGSDEYFDCIDQAAFDVLFIHFMDYNKSRAVLKLKRKVIIIWHVWGADLYQSGFYKKNLYQPETKKLLSALKRNRSKLLDYLKKICRPFYYYVTFKIPIRVAYKKAVSRVNYCATIIPDEITILKEWKFFKAAPVLFSITSIEGDFSGNDMYNDTVNGNGILIGNSIDPTANHLDCFYKLYNIGVNDRDIIVPLTYGPQLAYRDAIIEKGKTLFDGHFKPQLNFMPRNEYINMLKSASVAIMNHNRQQAVANIIALLWLGCKVFLSEKNITLAYLKRKGVFVYSFQNELNKESLYIPLTKAEIKKNRELIFEEFGHENVLKKAKSLIELVNKKCL